MVCHMISQRRDENGSGNARSTTGGTHNSTPPSTGATWPSSWVKRCRTGARVECERQGNLQKRIPLTYQIPQPAHDNTQERW